MTEHLETMAQLADRLGLDYPRLQWHLRHRPLPPIAVIRRSKIGIAHTEEQARWYLAHIPHGAGRHATGTTEEWTTPYDDIRPREYVGIPEIANATGKPATAPY